MNILQVTEVMKAIHLMTENCENERASGDFSRGWKTHSDLSVALVKSSIPNTVKSSPGGVFLLEETFPCHFLELAPARASRAITDFHPHLLIHIAVCWRTILFNLESKHRKDFIGVVESCLS